MGRQQNTLSREEKLRVAQGRPLQYSNGRDSREIQRDIDRTRSAMDETLDELGERLNPRNLLDDVIDIFRSPRTQDAAKRAGSGASDFVGNFGRQLRENPVGTSLVGAGLAWLALGSRREDDQDQVAPIPQRRALQDDYVVGVDNDFDDGFDDEVGYYAEDDLILDRTYSPEPEGAEIVVPETYSNDGSQPGTRDRIKASAKGAASAASSSCNSAWDGTKETASSAADSVSNAAATTGEAISDAASSVVDGVKSAASSVAGAASSAGSSTSSAARQAYLRSRAASRDAYKGTANTARSARRRTRSASRSGADQVSQAFDATSQRVKRAHDEAPLALGLGIMALGAIAGALIPRTGREDELMGETSDEAIRNAQQQAQQAYERGEAAVVRTAETAKRSAESQGLDTQSLAQRATNVVEKATESIAEAAKEEGLHPSQLKDDAKTVADETTNQAKSEAEDAKETAKAKAAKVDKDAEKATS